ncbi:hypothetical protein ACQCSX_13280 [Pseudarthrobacter sp. P1]|uniref:hypothetical protein n=1 Tax=Pseudarthrobacter sp. P1 TaxID=3418418 RepID=UPI003CF2CC74
MGADAEGEEAMSVPAFAPQPRSADMAALAARLFEAADAVDSLRRRLHNAGQVAWTGTASAAFQKVLAERGAELAAAANELSLASDLVQQYSFHLWQAESTSAVEALP